MYYVLFHHKKKRGKAWIPCSIESKVIEFLHENYGDIEVHEIIEVKATYQLGLVVTGDYIKSELEPKEELSEGFVQGPKEKPQGPASKKHPLLKNQKEEPSAMEKIGDDIEKEIKENGMTDEEKVDKQIDEADAIIEREKKREEQRKKGWELCTRCNSNRVSPWNKKGICSPCQGPKGTRPRSKEFSGL